MLNLGKSEVIDDFKKKENEPHVDWMKYKEEETREVSKSEILRWRRLKTEASDGHCFIWGGEVNIVSLKLIRIINLEHSLLENTEDCWLEKFKYCQLRFKTINQNNKKEPMTGHQKQKIKSC